jgi:hypothetical protein
MAVKALSWLGKKASKRDDVATSLRKAAKESDPMLRKTAKEAMKDLGIKE